MEKRQRKIIITGPTGCIGIAMLEKCIEKKTEVLAVCRRGSKRMGHIPASPYIHIIEAGLEELKDVSRFPQGEYDTFYHLAWDGTFGDDRNRLDLQLHNIRYTIDAVRLARHLGCNTFIGAGSQAEYGRVEGALRPDTPTFPENGYGMAKLCAGQMSRLECERYGMGHIWTRILSVYGPGDGMGTMVMSALTRMLCGEDTSFTAGEQMWDYLYSADAANALYLLGEEGHNGRIYCIGSGVARPLKEYIGIMHRLTHSGGRLGLGDLPYRDRQVMALRADITSLTEDVGFVPKVDFEEGIQKTIEWLRQKRGQDL